MNINGVDDLDVLEHHVVHPETHEKMGAVILLAGPEHELRRQFRLTQERALKRRMAKERDAIKAIVSTDPEEDEQKTLEFAVTCTVGWKDFEWGAEKLPYSKGNVEMVYHKKAWLLKQVLRRLGDEDAFTRSSATPSSPTSSTSLPST